MVQTPRKADVPDSDHGPEVAYEGEKRRAQVYVLSSSDHGKTWANPRPLPKPHWHPWIQHFGRVAELSNGDLLLPVYGKSSQRYAAYYRSRDHGVNWVGPTIFLSPARREMNLVQVPRGPVNFIGTLLAVIRNHGELGGQRREFAIAYSIDLGYTWRRPQLKEIQGKMSDLLVQNGQLFMVVGLEGLADGSEALKLSRSSNVFQCQQWPDVAARDGGRNAEGRPRLNLCRRRQSGFSTAVRGKASFGLSRRGLFQERRSAVRLVGGLPPGGEHPGADDLVPVVAH